MSPDVRATTSSIVFLASSLNCALFVAKLMLDANRVS
jgi:hypothetical protein